MPQWAVSFLEPKRASGSDLGLALHSSAQRGLRPGRHPVNRTEVELDTLGLRTSPANILLALSQVLLYLTSSLFSSFRRLQACWLEIIYRKVMELTHPYGQGIQLAVENEEMLCLTQWKTKQWRTCWHWTTVGLWARSFQSTAVFGDIYSPDCNQSTSLLGGTRWYRAIH